MSRAHPTPWFRPSRRTFYVTINGVQHNLHTADEAEALQRWHELIVKLAKAVPVSAGDQAPVAVLLAEFLEWAERNKSPGTYEWHRNYLHRFLASLPRQLRVAELRPYHVTQWLDQHSKWGPNSRRGAVTSVKRAFLWAVSEGHLERSPVANVKKPPAKSREVVLTAKQRRLIFATATDAAFRDVLNLIQETGARPQEVRAVEARHVDLKQAL
ncbi:MAG TPA: hypothetical protein VL475_04625, partial [Planctomycetaceae bacterium]|nr:hypothetical protein [Planctomycetaceae bacterium]